VIENIEAQRLKRFPVVKDVHLEYRNCFIKIFHFYTVLQ